MWTCCDISVVFNCCIGYFCRIIWLNGKSEHSELQSAAPGSLKPFAHGRWWTGCLTLPISSFVQSDISTLQFDALPIQYPTLNMIDSCFRSFVFNITPWGRWASGGLSYFLCFIQKSSLHYSNSALLSTLKKILKYLVGSKNQSNQM